MSSTNVLTVNSYEPQDASYNHKTHTAAKTVKLSRGASLQSSDKNRPKGSREHHDEPEPAALVTSALDRMPVAAVETETPLPVKAARANLIIFQLTVVNFLTSLTTGLIVVGLPQIAADIKLAEHLYLWPSSVFGLTAGAALLPTGAIADVLGPRSIELVGVTLLGVFTLGCGFASTGIQLVMFRAFQGLAIAMHLPCSVSLVTQYVPSGKKRNIGFACLGLSMPLGFSVGLVLGGVLVDTIGWRVGFYIAGAVMLVQAIASFRIIPADILPENVMSKLRTEIDWVGATISSAGLAMLSYVLAILSTDSNNIRQPSAIVMLTISVGLIIVFPLWMWHQEKHNRPALIPNYLWKNKVFSCICVLTVLTWGVMNSMELFASL